MIVERIEGYGVVLKRLTKDKIEMVRNWRNDPKIQQYMFFRDYITPEMQEAWFTKIDNEYNHYFIIEVDGKEIGLVNIKDVDYENKVGESGIFIYDDECLNGIMSYQVILVMFDFAYETLELEKLTAVIEKSNQRAIDFNLSLGAKIVSEELNVVSIEASREDYYNNQKIRQYKNIFLKLYK